MSRTTRAHRAAPATRAARRRPRVASWVPRQHGAWAMLLLPFLAGALRSGFVWLHLLLLAFWLAGYFAFNATAVWVKSRGKPRFRPPVLTYGALTLGLGLPIVWLRPDLLVWAPVFAVCLATSLWFSWRRHERALANDIVTILAACAFGLVTYQAGYSPEGTIEVGWRTMGVITAVLFAYFVGTALYVKTMIRERGQRAWVWASVGYHAAVTAALGVLAVQAFSAGLPPGMQQRPLVALAALFALLTARAWLLAGRRIRPLIVGLGEIGVCLALLGVIALWR
ncbi:hypothetical protein BJY21_003718 [Kineosphaera limosa]|nr:YwiC-like family protein [Kineosphaera limosa]NYE02534.1 hypothetical protein [Kineosphaera limosa]